MTRLFNKDHLRIARRNLRINQTIEEDILWEEIRNLKLGVKFRRQFSINNYIVDFYCPKCRLVIEIDGKIHLTKIGKEKDKVRDATLRSMGITVLRFWSSEVQRNINKVIEVISQYLTPGPSPSKGEGEW